MGILNKEWKAKLSNGSEIIIKNFTSLRETGRSIHIDGKEIYLFKRSILDELISGIQPFFRFSPLKYSINHTFNFENSIIDVRMGFHFFFPLKCIVKEDTKYLIGNAESQLYIFTPLFIWLFLIQFVATFSFAYLVIWWHYDVYIKNYLSAKNNFHILWKNDLRKMYKEKLLENFINSKQKEWEILCKAQNDHTCRLAGYVYSLKDNDKKEMELNTIPCYQSSNLRSCYSIFVNSYFHRNNEEYYKLTNKLYDLCLSNSLNDQEQESCIYFSQTYFKDFGDIEKVNKLRNLHCTNKFENICKKL